MCVCKCVCVCVCVYACVRVCIWPPPLTRITMGYLIIHTPTDDNDVQGGIGNMSPGGGGGGKVI